MTLSTAATVALYAVLVFVVIFALVTVVLLGMIALTLRVTHSKLEEALDKMEPLLAKTSETLDTVQRVTNNVGARADTILEKGEALTDDVARKVEKTASFVQKAVETPLIKVSSVIAGVTEGLSSLSRHFGASRVNSSDEKRTRSNGHE
jgi:uncharacterized protein YoxC